MKVAYVFSTSGHTASYKLGKMILPQLEQGTHGVEVVGLFFFDDNNYILRKGDPIGERLARVAAEQGILLMMCDQCAVERGLAEGEPNVPQSREARRNRRWSPSRLLPGPLHSVGRQHAGSGHFSLTTSGFSEHSRGRRPCQLDQTPTTLAWESISQSRVLA